MVLHLRKLILISSVLVLVARWAGSSDVSVYPLASAACNRPAGDIPPAPDGCPDWAPIAPPDAPIPPPCIVDFQVEGWDEENAGVTELAVYVDHPELGPGVWTYTRLARYGGGVWELTDADWEASCGKDEGPLAWTTLEILNSGRLSPLGIYTVPLPGTYLDLLAELGGRRWHHVYLSLIRSDRGTPGED